MKDIGDIPFQDCESQALLDAKAHVYEATRLRDAAVVARIRRIEQILHVDAIQEMHKAIVHKLLANEQTPVLTLHAMPSVPTHKGKRIAKWKLDRNPHLRHKR